MTDPSTRPTTAQPDSIALAARWIDASGIPVMSGDVRAWLDQAGVPVPVGIQPLMAVIRAAVIAAGDAGYAAGRSEPATTSQSPSREDLAAALADELVQLWGDLSSAVGYALNGCWSIQCENLAERIVELSRLVGPTGWEHVGVDLLLGGVYERVHREAGIEFPAVDWPQVHALHARIKTQASRR